MDWNRNACWIAGLGIDMMAAVDALQFPAMPFQVESPARPVLHPMTGLRRWLRIPDRVQPGVGSPGTRGSDSTRLRGCEKIASPRGETQFWGEADGVPVEKPHGSETC